MLDDFVRRLIKGMYANQSNGKHSEIVSEHGDVIRVILTRNRFADQPKRKNDSRCEDISSEHGDLILAIVELDTFNLLTLFGEHSGVTLIDNDPDIFKVSDLFNENGKIYDDTLWSSPDHGDVVVRNEHGCLLSVFDCDAVAIIQSEYGPLTVMSACQPPHRGARPTEPLSVPRIRYACIACQFDNFQSAHSLRRHLAKIHDLGCDTLVNGRSFPHVGYVMRRANANERHTFPRTVFPNDWADSQREEVDPEPVSDHPPCVIDSWGSGQTYAVYPSEITTNTSLSLVKGSKLIAVLDVDIYS